MDNRNLQYNPDVIVQYAGRLIRNADNLLILGAFFAFVIVFVGVIVDIYYLETHVGTIFALINAGIIFISFRELSSALLSLVTETNQPNGAIK